MRARSSLIALGFAATLTLTACQPGDQGHTGLMLSGDDTLHGVVNVCKGSVNQLGLVEQERHMRLRTWMFDVPISGLGTVELGTLVDIIELVDSSSELYFSAGTSGKAGTTTPLYFADFDLDELETGEVLYTGWLPDQESVVVETLPDYDAFEALSCDSY